MIPPTIGKSVVNPLTTLKTLAAAMLFILNSFIRKTIKLLVHPPAASDNPAIVAEFHNQKLSNVSHILTIGNKLNLSSNQKRIQDLKFLYQPQVNTQ